MKNKMKTSSTVLALSLFALSAHAEMSLSGSTAGTLGDPSSSTTGTSVSMPLTAPTVTSIPQAGTSAGSPQTAGPLNSAPNGMGGTYGYPNSANDPNTTNPGLPQPAYYGGPSYNYGAGSVSGTTTSVNAAGAPFVQPPVTPGSSVPGTAH